MYTSVAYVYIAVTTGLAVTLQVAIAQAHGRPRAAGRSAAPAALASVVGMLGELCSALLRGSGGP